MARCGPGLNCKVLLASSFVNPTIKNAQIAVKYPLYGGIFYCGKKDVV